jgi:hypothetical protein
MTTLFAWISTSRKGRATDERFGQHEQVMNGKYGTYVLIEEVPGDFCHRDAAITGYAIGGSG